MHTGLWFVPLSLAVSSAACVVEPLEEENPSGTWIDEASESSAELVWTRAAAIEELKMDLPLEDREDVRESRSELNWSPVPTEIEELKVDPAFEDAGDEMDAITGGTACRGACLAVGVMGCGLVLSSCTGVTVITIGGTTLPCVWAATVACAVTQFGLAACIDVCPA